MPKWVEFPTSRSSNCLVSEGLVVDPTGRIVDLPIKSNYRIGFSTFEYVSATRGERKVYQIQPSELQMPDI